MIHTHLSQRLALFILTVVPLLYFSSCFPLAFLKGHCPFLSLEVTSLCLDPVTWDPSVLSNKVASSASILFWSCWRYSNHFFFFSSSTSFYLSSCLLSCMFHMTDLCCCLQMNQELLFLVPLLYLMVLFFKHFSIVLGNIGGGRGRHDDIEEKAKGFLFHLCIVDLSTIIGFLDKLNRTSKAQF